MDTAKKIWSYDIEEIVKGYTETEEAYICTMCGEVFEKGKIYDIDSELVDAYGAACCHGSSVHGRCVDYLLEQDGSMTGLSEVQRRVLCLMSAGKQDSEIASAMGIAASTVRNHRFKLREKEKQARLFLALMRSLEEKSSTAGPE